jgi:hypothetical protein
MYFVNQASERGNRVDLVYAPTAKGECYKREVFPCGTLIAAQFDNQPLWLSAEILETVGNRTVREAV